MGTVAPSHADADTEIASVQPSLLLLQSEVGDDLVMGTAFVVKSGETCLALTSYEAVMGASIIRALAPGQGLVPAHLVKFAPEANLALLEIPVPNIPAVKICDYEMLRPKTPLKVICNAPIMDGNEASSSTTNVRSGSLQSTITRPNGAILRVTFNPGIDDQTTGAPMMVESTGEVAAVSLSPEISQVDTMRFAVPARYVTALCPELSNGSEIPSFVKVKDGKDAPVKKGTAKKSANGYDTWTYAIVIGFALCIVGFIYYKTRSKKEKIVPFSNLPLLPDGVEMAFVTADGKILPSDAESIKIGRAADNTWCFPDSTVSNYHARIRKNKNPKHFEVDEVRRSNGTCVGKRRVVSAETVTPGTKIRFGKKVEVMLMLRSQSTNPLANLNLNIKKIQ